MHKPVVAFRTNWSLQTSQLEAFLHEEQPIGQSMQELLTNPNPIPQALQATPSSLV